MKKPFVSRTARLPQKPLLLLGALAASSSVAVVTPNRALAAPSVRHNTSMTKAPSFADFDARARAGQELRIVFFGASLTWGANSTSPQETSYRAQIARNFAARYPRAHFQFFDAAIGGTGSRLGVFRLERDVLQRRPDLVFLDFSLNDDLRGTDEDALAAYESLVRRCVVEGHCPVVQVAFPGAHEVEHPDELLPRVEAHRRIAFAYGSGWGDAVSLLRTKARRHPEWINQWWDSSTDRTHPGDRGYLQYAEAAWQGFLEAVRDKREAKTPAQPMHGSSYNAVSRFSIASLKVLPTGWRRAMPNRTSAWYDALMSRWLDEESVAAPSAVPLEMRFRGQSVLLFGEKTPLSGAVRVWIDGKLSTLATDGTFDASSKSIGGNIQFAPLVVQGLKPDQDHTLRLEPLLEAGQELRLESVCIAGQQASVANETASQP